jgi:Zn-dependent metalloprotease
MKKRPLVSLGMAAVCALALGAATPAQAAPTQDPAQDPKAVAVARAAAAIRENPDAVHASPDDAYTVWRVVLDPDGVAHVRYHREYRGLPVVGGDLVVHLSRDGWFVRAATSLAAPIKLDTAPKVDAAEAAKAILGRRDAVITDNPELVVDAGDGTASLAWRAHATVAGEGETAFVDAVEGRLSRTDSDARESGTGDSMYAGTVPLETTGSGAYNLVDATRGNATTCDLGHNLSGACPTFTDADNTWGDGTPSNNQTAAVDVHYGTANAYDYFKNVLGRDGIFGDGTGVTSRVHQGTNWVNARWLSPPTSWNTVTASTACTR